MSFKDIPIGIDLGTTNSCIGAFINGRVEIIQNQISERTTPSIVSFCDKEISIGEQTLNKVQNDPEKVIYSVKRFIGKKFTDGDFNKMISKLAYKNCITKYNDDRPIINVNFKGENRSYFPEEISAMVLKRLKENAEISLKSKIKKVVITIPAYFTESQREATKIAANGAGLEVIKIINEPTAAALAYGIGKKEDLKKFEVDEEIFSLFNQKEKVEEDFTEKKILVFDLGGGTLDVTCLNIIKDDEGTALEILGHSGDTQLGGDDFDNLLVDHCINIFSKANKIDINARNSEDIKARKRLKIACEKAKKILSFQAEAKITIDSLYKEIDFQLNLTRAKFEFICKDKFNSIIKPIEEALKASKLNKNDIDEILFVGGSTRMPAIEKKILEYFGNIKINKRINPDEVVAYGATLQAAIIMNEKSMDDVLINDICSHSLGISVVRNLFANIYIPDMFDKLIKNGTNIPYDVEKEYTTLRDYQTSVTIQIYEGENDFCINNRLLGKFTLENITKEKKGVPKIKVKFLIDDDSILHVTATETISGATNSISIKHNKAIMKEDEINLMKKKLENKTDFEETKINLKEKEICEKKRLKIQEFRETKTLSSLKEIEKLTEELVEISLDNFNKNNLEKKFYHVKYLFQIYNYLFNEYFDEYKNKSNEYLKKIKKYMEIFKEEDPYYLKNLVLIFKDDKYNNRFSEIVYYCVKLFINAAKKNEKKIFCCYYNESINLIQTFKDKINESKYNTELNSLENLCILERAKFLTESEKKVEKHESNIKNLTIDEAILAIDQYQYVYENLDTINEKTSRKEKEIRAYILTKIIDLELHFFTFNNFDKLKKMVTEALSLVKQCELTEESDEWICILNNCKNKIDEIINLNQEKETREMRLSFSKIIEKDISGNNENENINFIEVLNNEFLQKDKKKQSREEIINLYKNDKKKLKRKVDTIIKNIPESNEELKNKKSWVKRAWNKITNFFK